MSQCADKVAIRR